MSRNIILARTAFIINIGEIITSINLHRQEGDSQQPAATSEKMSSSEEYDMAHKYRGTAIIIINYAFPGEQYRHGADQDIIIVKDMFEKMGFTTMVHENKTGEQMRTILSNAAEDKNNSESDCFACAISSHGNEGNVSGVDGDEVTIKSLLGKLYASKCPTLLNKPKLFFIQACQGGHVDEGGDVEYDDMTVPMVFRFQIEADFLIASATPPGYKAWRDRNRGSWFIQALHAVISADCFTEDFLTLMTNVNGTMANNFSTPKDGRTLFQISSCISMLRKTLKFTKK